MKLIYININSTSDEIFFDNIKKLYNIDIDMFNFNQTPDEKTRIEYTEQLNKYLETDRDLYVSYTAFKHYGGGHATCLIIKKEDDEQYAYLFCPNGMFDYHNIITFLFEYFINRKIKPFVVSITPYAKINQIIKMHESKSTNFQDIFKYAYSYIDDIPGTCVMWTYLFIEIFLKAYEHIGKHITPFDIYKYIYVMYDTKKLAYLINTYIHYYYSDIEVSDDTSDASCIKLFTENYEKSQKINIEHEIQIDKSPDTGNIEREIIKKYLDEAKNAKRKKY